MTDYLYTKYGKKVGNHAHFTYDGKTPLCRAEPRSGGKFVLDSKRGPVSICGKCYIVAYESKPDYVEQQYEQEQKDRHS